MTEPEIIGLLTEGVRIRFVPHNLGKNGSLKDPRDLYIGKDRVPVDSPSECSQLLVGMVREGKLEEHDDPVCGVSEFLLPGTKAVWEE